jgi:hypothetical protein
MKRGNVLLTLKAYIGAGFLAVLASALAGCSIKQHVTPVEHLASSEICIIQNATVRQSFLAVYEAALKERGYTTKLLDERASLTDCDVTSTYLGLWSWDLALYMSYAKITIYYKGHPAGEVVYDASGAGVRLDKFVDAELKIRDLVAQLFPART